MKTTITERNSDTRPCDFYCRFVLARCMVINMYYPRLKDLRDDKDLNQSEVAAILGIDQRVYSNYETGYREIPTRFVVKLADYYKTSADYILGRTNKK